MTSFPPALLYFAGAIVIPWLPARLRQVMFLAVTVISFGFIVNLNPGESLGLSFLDLELVPLRVDGLSLAFGYVFSLVAFLGGLYAFHLKDRSQQVAALLYAGAALGAVFAGDLFSLFVFWEIMLIGSSYLIWSGNRRGSEGAGMRYILFHLFGGSLLLAGIIWHYSQTGSILWMHFEGPSSWLILAGFAVNAAIPPVHAWLSDAYPEASITGSVFLSAFTTKVAVYALIRGFEGLEILLWAGAVMVIYGAIYALIENDLRRILAYSTISQVGFMVTAVGIGGQLAINGAVAHAFGHILYKALLFMAAGALIYATGKNRLTQLGGLKKRLPLIFGLYTIGAMAISGFPLFSGFVTKPVILYAAESNHLDIVYVLLYLASIGTFLHTGLRLPYYAWMGKESQIPLKSLPSGMYWAMGLAGLSCLVIGIFPGILYNVLPYDLQYHPYTAGHLWETLGLLLFSGMVFWLIKHRLKPGEMINLDIDWFYRRPAHLAYRLFVEFPSICFGQFGTMTSSVVNHLSRIAANPPGFLIWHSKNVFNRLGLISRPETEPAVFNPHRYRTSVGWMIIILMLVFVVLLFAMLVYTH